MGLGSRIASAFGFVPAQVAAEQARAAADAVVRDYSLGWPSPLLSGLMGAAGSSTGTPVTSYSALQSSAVYSCVTRKSVDLAKLPAIVERNTGGDYWRVDPDHPFNEVLRRPNIWQTPFEFWRFMVTSLELRGNAIAVIKRGFNGSPVALIPLNWDRVSVLLSQHGLMFYLVNHPQVGMSVTFHQDDIIHIRGLSIDGGYLGMTPIALAQDVVGLAIATQQHGATLFRRGAQLGGLLKHPATLSPEAAQRLAESFGSVYGGVQNSHKTAVLEEGMTFEKLTMTNEDSQFLQTRAFQVLEVCRIFGVPPHKIYDLSKSSFSTLEQQEQAYVNDTLDPMAINVQQAVDAKVFFEDERLGWRIRFDLRSLLRGDQKARSEFYGSGLNNGWLSVNEVRAFEGMGPVVDGDKYRVPLNTAPVGSPAANNPGGNDKKPGEIGSQAHDEQETETTE